MEYLNATGTVVSTIHSTDRLFSILRQLYTVAPGRFHPTRSYSRADISNRLICSHHEGVRSGSLDHWWGYLSKSVSGGTPGFGVDAEPPLNSLYFQYGTPTHNPDFAFDSWDE